jgi:hypothetical protein
MLLLDDKGFPSAFEVLPTLKSRTGDVPLAVFADYEQFVEKLARRELLGGVMFQVKKVPDVDAANRCMENVRRYRV